jgi:hypothetical protein
MFFQRPRTPRALQYLGIVQRLALLTLRFDYCKFESWFCFGGYLGSGFGEGTVARNSIVIERCATILSTGFSDLCKRASGPFEHPIPLPLLGSSNALRFISDGLTGVGVLLWGRI